MAQLRLLREKFPKELVIISVHSAKFPSEGLTRNIREAIMRHGLDHPVVNDVNFQVWQSYTVKAWPTIVVIDPQGKIVHTQSGEILAEEFAPDLEALINEAEGKGLLDRTPLDLQMERVQEPLRPLDYPAKALLTDRGVLYIADTGHHRILEVHLSEDSLKGEIGRVFGSGQPGLQDGPAATAAFHSPHGLALSGDTLYVADTENHAIRAVALDSGAVRTVAGTGEKAHGRFNLGQPTETPLRSPWAVLVVEDIVFIAMAGIHQIWALFQEEQIGPFFGNGREALVDGDQMQSSFNQPSDLSLGMGHMFVADAEASAIRAISLLEEKPHVVTLVGQGLFEFGDMDGRGSMVRLQHPTGLTFYEGLVYIADSYNHKIKTLDPTTGEVKTLIGTGQPGQADGAFHEAGLFEPEGVVASKGRLYIADTNNHLIRVAYLKEKTVRTLALHGLERLPLMLLSEPKAQRLDPLTVGPGEVEISLIVELPEGYKLNPDAPQMIQLQGNNVSTTHLFQANEPAHFKVDIEMDDDLNLNLTIYYCQSSDERLCLIHDVRLRLPLIVKEEANTSAQVRYRVSP